MVISPIFGRITIWICRTFFSDNNNSDGYILNSCDYHNAHDYRSQKNLSPNNLVSLRSYERLVIPVTRRVKGYTRFVGKYVTGRRKRFQPHKVYIFLIRITSRVDLAMSVGPDERCDFGNYSYSL